MTSQETLREYQILARELWGAYARIFPKLAQFECPTIKLNNRFTRTGAWNKSEENLVELGAKFLPKNAREMRATVMPHELAHQIDYNLFGWKPGERHHRKTWQIIMVDIGQIPNIYHTMKL